MQTQINFEEIKEIKNPPPRLSENFIYNFSLGGFSVGCLALIMTKSFACSPVKEYLIDEIFPGLKPFSTGIYLEEPISREGNLIYPMKAFSEAERNRNHWDSRSGEEVRYLVQHYTVGTFVSTLRTFTANIPSGRVSAHYVVSQDEKDVIEGGNIIQIVPEKERAWHAGVSYWGEIPNLNSNSIGIENVNHGFRRYTENYNNSQKTLFETFDSLENLIKDTAQKTTIFKDPLNLVNYLSKQKGLLNNFLEENLQGSLEQLSTLPEDFIWYDFDSKQIDALGRLSQDIVLRHKIAPYNVIGHADIAPGRKQDPGILFPWRVLHEKYKVGAWLIKDDLSPERINKLYTPKEPLPGSPSVSFMTSYLNLYGYNIKPESKITPEVEPVLKAFRSHFSYNGQPAYYKPEIEMKDMMWVWGLVSKYGDYVNRKI